MDNRKYHRAPGTGRAKGREGCGEEEKSEVETREASPEEWGLS